MTAAVISLLMLVSAVAGCDDVKTEGTTDNITVSGSVSEENETSEEKKTSDTTDTAKETEASAVMPDVTGMDYKKAQDYLEDYFEENGISVSISVGWGHNSDPSKNLLVAETTPKAGEDIDPSVDTVIIMVYEGYNPTDPSDTDQTETEGTTESSESTETEGTVKPTDTSGTEGTSGTTGSSQPSGKTTVIPDVVGMNYQDAQDTIKEAFSENGLDVTVCVGWGHNSDPAKNLLVAEITPAAGTDIDPSVDTVIIMVYEGYNPPN